MIFALLTKTLLLSSLTNAAGNSTAFVRPFFSADLVFQVFTNAPATDLRASSFKTYYYQEAEAKCGLSSERISSALSNFNGWVAIEKYIPRAQKKFSSLQVVIGVDYFQDGIEQHASFQVDDVPARKDHFIGLDCRLFYSNLWQSRLSHEIVHVLLASQKFPIWFEEMTAQTVESELNPDYFARAVSEVGKTSVFPNPLDTHRPFHEKGKYFLNLLLGRYLHKSLLQRNFFPAVVSLPDGELLKKSWPEDFAEFVAPQVTWLPAKLKASDLLKNFYVALMLNTYDLDGRGVYKIQGWSGFKAPPLTRIPNGMVLQPGAALRVTTEVARKIMAANSKRLEFLMINKAGQEFKIFVNDQIQSATPTELQTAGEVLVLNTSAEPHFEWP